MQDSGDGQDKAANATLKEHRAERRLEPAVTVGAPPEHREQHGHQFTRAIFRFSEALV